MPRQDFMGGVFNRPAAVVSGATTNAAAARVRLDILSIGTIDQMMQDAKLRALSLIVDAKHSGDPEVRWARDTGTTITCGYHTASLVNSWFPLRLVRVLSPDRAEFDVATPLSGAFIPLSAPPYKMPQP